MSEYRFNLLSLQQKDYLILGDSFCKHTIFRLDAHYSQTYLCAITK
jgi:hypothetical protein